MSSGDWLVSHSIASPGSIRVVARVTMSLLLTAEICARVSGLLVFAPRSAPDAWRCELCCRERVCTACVDAPCFAGVRPVVELWGHVARLRLRALSGCP